MDSTEFKDIIRSLDKKAIVLAIIRAKIFYDHIFDPNDIENMFCSYDDQSVEVSHNPFYHGGIEMTSMFVPIDDLFSANEDVIKKYQQEKNDIEERIENTKKKHEEERKLKKEKRDWDEYQRLKLKYEHGKVNL